MKLRLLLASTLFSLSLGCDPPIPSGYCPDAQPLAVCSSFCIYEDSHWQCDSRGHCECFYERDKESYWLECRKE